MNAAVGVSVYFRLIGLLFTLDEKRNQLKIDTPDTDYVEIEHLPSGRWVRVFNHGDSCQVMHYESEDDEFGRFITATDHRDASGKIFAYLEDHISFEENAA